MKIDSREKLNELNKLALLSGRLSEIHIKNLKMYPFIYFEELKNVEMSYNIVTDENSSLPGVGSVIRYKLDFDKEKNGSILNKRVEALKNSVKTLLWPQVTVHVVDKSDKELIE